jgi:hypothetical protein
MNAIQKAIEVLQGCLEHPGADDAIAGLRAMLDQLEPLTIGKIASMDYRGTLCRHIQSVRMAEAAHGITKGGT